MNNSRTSTQRRLIALAILTLSLSFGSGLVTRTTVTIRKHRNVELFATRNDDSNRITRRDVISTSMGSAALLLPAFNAHAKTIPVLGEGRLFEVHDPQTYPALVYIPKMKEPPTTKLPVLIILHGAGKNELDVWNLADIQGEHSGLAPSLLAAGKAPPELYENFIVIAPYSKGRTSFYEEPRSKLLQFIRWACSSDGGGMQGIDVDIMDLDRQFLFGFSDGATLGIELMTTRKFAGGVFAAYGFTGKLPPLALERLQGLPMWIFHSADDVIFPVRCSDQLVKDLRAVNEEKNDLVRYSRFDRDQEGFTGSVKGHSTGITASKNSEIYTWLLSL